MVITYLKLSDVANRRAPRQSADDLALVREWIEVHAMLLRPAVRGRGRKDRSLIGDVSVLERELPDAEFSQPLDISPHHSLVVDMPARHHARGPNSQAAGRFEEPAKGRSRLAHQSAVLQVIKVMSRKAEVRQAGACQFLRQAASQQTAIGETGDFVKKLLAAANDVEHRARAQQRLAAAGDDQPRRSALARKLEVAFEVDLAPIDRVVPQRTYG